MQPSEKIITCASTLFQSLHGGFHLGFVSSYSSCLEELFSLSNVEFHNQYKRGPSALPLSREGSG